MIYSFSVGDRKKDSFLDLLQQSGIDFEVVEHDSVVVRILGTVSKELKTKLDQVRTEGQSLTIKRNRERDCYQQMKSRKGLAIIAGPCAVETEEQIATVAGFLGGLGIKYLRGGAYKPRTSVDSFQGLGRPGLKLLRKYADIHDMFVVTEVMDRSQIDDVAEFADVLQVGSRNMYNYTLLTALGSMRKPVLLKRGMAATIEEWLASAEYVSRGGNDEIILCERGIRTFEPQVAHVLDLAAVYLAKQQSPYPVIADTSHAAGRADLVIPLARAAVAAGADGIMVEMHPHPEAALSDGKQALTLDMFEELLRDVTKIFDTVSG